MKATGKGNILYKLVDWVNMTPALCLLWMGFGGHSGPHMWLSDTAGAPWAQCGQYHNEVIYENERIDRLHNWH